eukprot:2649764-Lingulodinium_polyedra.AAC.1
MIKAVGYEGQVDEDEMVLLRMDKSGIHSGASRQRRPNFSRTNRTRAGSPPGHATRTADMGHMQECH